MELPLQRLVIPWNSQHSFLQKVDLRYTIFRCFIHSQATMILGLLLLLFKFLGSL